MNNEMREESVVMCSHCGEEVASDDLSDHVLFFHELDEDVNALIAADNNRENIDESAFEKTEQENVAPIVWNNFSFRLILE